MSNKPDPISVALARTTAQQAILDEFLVDQLAGICIDTSIFEQKGLDFERPPLSLLKRIGDTAAPLLLPETIVGELERHVRHNRIEVERDLQSIIHKAVRLLSSRGAPGTLEKEILDMFPTALDASTAQVARFLEEACVTVLRPTEYVSIDEIQKRYLDRTPPFDTFGAKNTKNECPDAIALLSLEEWGRRRGGSVVVCSRDGDWLRFASTSDRLLGIDSLEDLLSLLNHRNVLYGSVAAETRNRLLDDKALRREILADCARSLEVNVTAEATTGFSHSVYAEAGWSVDKKEFVEDTHGQPQAEVLNLLSNFCSVAVELTVEITLDVDLTFQRWDYEDRQFQTVAGGTIKRTVTAGTTAFIRFEGNMEKPSEIEYSYVDVEPIALHEEFEDVVPDF